MGRVGRGLFETVGDCGGNRIEKSSKFLYFWALVCYSNHILVSNIDNIFGGTCHEQGYSKVVQ